MQGIAKYRECIDEFIATCSQLDSEIVSILLYGSVARGDMRPGRSDVLDATIVFENQVLSNESEFYRALDVMVHACKQLSSTGLPFHPFHYFTYQEVCHSYWFLYLAPWKSSERSQILRGRDIRPLFRSIDEGDWFNRGAIFAEHYRAQNANRFMTMDLAVLPNRRSALQNIKWFIKTMPHLACVTCDCDVDPANAISMLKHIIPELDVECLYKLYDLRNIEVEEISAEDVRRALGELMRINCELIDGVTAWLKAHGLWDSFMDTTLGDHAAQHP